MKVSLKVMLSLVGRFGALSNDELSLGAGVSVFDCLHG